MKLLNELVKAKEDRKKKVDFRQVELSVTALKTATKKGNILPKEELQKHVIHLENNLEGFQAYATSLENYKKVQDGKVSILENELKSLKKKLSLYMDDDLHKKVERLSLLIAEHIAQSLSENLPAKISSIQNKLNELKKDQNSDPAKIKELEQKVLMLKRKFKPMVPPPPKGL